MPSVHEHFSEQFYNWEKRGRGWQVYEYPVSPEPPFVPFSYRPMTDPPAVDDGRRPTFLSSLFRKIAAPLPPPVVEPESETEVAEPAPKLVDRGPVVEFQAALPSKLDIADEVFETFLTSLSRCHEPMAFELLGVHNKIMTQFVAPSGDRELVHRQLQAFFPEAAFIPVENNLETAWDDTTGQEMLAVEFGLEREFIFPIQSGKIDPFISIIGALSGLRAGELGLFQVLWQPVSNRWAEVVLDAVSDANGRPHFVNASELTSAAEIKASKPMYAAVVRILVCAERFDRVSQLAGDLAGALRVFAHPKGNALIPLKNDEYPFEMHITDVLSRQTRRTGMLLNSGELTSFVHLPSSAVRSPLLQRNVGVTKAAPDMLRQSGVLIGGNEHNGQVINVRLTSDQRIRHTHIIGSSGTGKSSLLFNLIQQDILNRDGVAVLDPHGDLVRQLLGAIPQERIQDVVLVDPSDQDFPIGFNILQAHSDVEKNLLASDLIAVFRRLASSWGDQMDTVLQNAILAFLESKQGGTLADLRRFLLEPAFRNQFLQTVADPEVIYYWQRVFPQLSGGRSIGPILTRLQDFFARKQLRNMVSQRENKLDFADIMDNGKIFLASLSEGLCGAENSYLLGTLLVSKFQQLAMARQSQSAASRRNFWLYIDEFDHFITPSMAEILKGARKYRLGLTLAHQALQQLKGDPNVESAVLTQPCTRIVFRVGDDDAKKLGEGFESFDARSLTNLEKFHAICRVERNDYDFNLAVRKPEAPTNPPAHIDSIVSASRKKYATPRTEVEAAMLASICEDRLVKPTVDATPEPKSEVVPVSDKEKVTEPSAVSSIPKTPKPPAKGEPPQQSQPIRDLGRGGAQHQAIQKRIKEEADVLGFRGIIEKPVLDGQGSVDLWLERDGQAIACEISISTTIDHEVGNVGKCLKAGIPNVAVISLDNDRLRKIEAAVAGSFGPELATKVEYFLPDPFIFHLKNIPIVRQKDPDAPEVRRGYRIRRNNVAVSPQEQKMREEEAVRLMAEAMRRKSK